MGTRTTPPAGWPPHERDVVAWSQSVRGGTRADRMLSKVEVWLPPHIASVPVHVEPRTVAAMESALREVAALDSEHGAGLDALGTLLLRTESVASSKIEHIVAAVDDYARALHGVRTNPAAVSMAAATDALASLIGSVDNGRDVQLGAVLTAHRALMAHDQHEKRWAGRLRDMQNWIGGSDHSPRNAMYVPPPPETVEPYLDDLMRFSNRNDVPVLAQAAIAHAQFESIHPFTDGNGRIGRALINTILRRRGATTCVVVPLASALVVHRDRYFDLLGAYRIGDPDPIQASFAEATAIAAHESRTTAVRLTEIPGEWRDMTGPVRANSAAAKLLALLPRNPIISADEATRALEAPQSSVYSALERLRQAGVLRPLTDRRRNQVWGAGLVLDELDDLSERIAAAAR